jgi:hypothetical protein
MYEDSYEDPRTGPSGKIIDLPPMDDRVFGGSPVSPEHRLTAAPHFTVPTHHFRHAEIPTAVPDTPLAGLTEEQCRNVRGTSAYAALEDLCALWEPAHLLNMGELQERTKRQGAKLHWIRWELRRSPTGAWTAVANCRLDEHGRYYGAIAAPALITDATLAGTELARLEQPPFNAWKLHAQTAPRLFYHTCSCTLGATRA